jgi:uracil-DNA glycosylase family 4
MTAGRRAGERRARRPAASPGPAPGASRPFDPDCTLCPRLAAYLAQARRSHPGYHARPVAPFGAPRPRLLVVGLAPGFHGANRTGRPFTGDHAGILLYATLHASGFASRPDAADPADDLRLIDCRITNAVKCVPPANSPQAGEVRTCNAYLRGELAALPRGAVILALGRTAHDAVLMALGERRAAFTFAHGAEHTLGNGLRVLDSYHCSRYNTQTRRLTPGMFEAVVQRARRLIDDSHA